MKKLYININDYQGGTWAIGCCQTLKEWREHAMTWADSDENWGIYNMLKYYKIKNKDLIDFINEYWEIEIVEYKEEYKRGTETSSIHNTTTIRT